MPRRGDDNQQNSKPASYQLDNSRSFSLLSLVLSRSQSLHTRWLLRPPIISLSAGFIVGVLGSNWWNALQSSRKKSSDRENAGASRENNGCTHFYGDERVLTVVGKNSSHLPDNLYGQLVRFSVVAGVECLVVRVNKLTDKQEVIVIERDDEPNKGTFCLPGGVSSFLLTLFF